MKKLFKSDSEDRDNSIENHLHQFDTAFKKSQSSSNLNHQDIVLDSKVWDHSFTIVNEAEQDFLQKIDDIVKKHLYNTNKQQLDSNKDKTDSLFNNLTMQNTRDRDNNLHNESQKRDNSDLTFKSQLRKVEKIVLEYRQQLQVLKKKQKQQMSQYIKQMKVMSEDIQYLVSETENNKKIINSKSQQINVLEKQNQNLKAQLQLIEKYRQCPTTIRKPINSKIKAKINQLSKKIMDESSYDFSQKIRSQLEKLIDKLMKQLQYQRKVNDRLKDQIIQVQNQMIVTEKTLKNKNNAIYELQLEIIRLKRQIYNKETQQKRKINSRELSKVDSKANLKDNSKSNIAIRYEESFEQSRSKEIEKRQNNIPVNKGRVKQFKEEQEQPILIHLKDVNKSRQLEQYERLTLCYKLIQFFENKHIQKDYSIEMLQNLALRICCINGETTDSYIVRLKPKLCLPENNISKDRQQKKQYSLYWNLGCILQSLFSDKQCSSQNSEIQGIVYPLKSARKKIILKVKKLYSEKTQIKKVILTEIKQAIRTALEIQQETN